MYYNYTLYNFFVLYYVMKSVIDPNRAICASYCKYYKPDKTDDDRCAGYDMVMIVMRARQIRCEAIPTRLRGLGEIGHIVIDTIRENVCGRCPYSADDCDFMASAGLLEPCGGFLLLADMLSSEKIKPEEIK